MKKFKKLTRENLKQIKGGEFIPTFCWYRKNGIRYQGMFNEYDECVCSVPNGDPDCDM